MTSHFDDGTPLDRSRRSPSRKSRGGQRDAALCKQVQRILTTELLDLPTVWIESIRPAPDVTRLAIRLVCASEHHAVVQQVIAGRTAYLRRSVAAGLRRRKAPELLILVVPGGGEELGGEVRR